SGGIGDIALVPYAITVVATNDQNQITSYSSVGGTRSQTGYDTMKPDLAAPGGSSYRSMMLLADTNNTDALGTAFADLQDNAHQAVQGTSASAPFVAGAAGLVIDAMQQAGTTWTWTDSTQPMFVKMILCATATETNTSREGGTNSPGLGRASAPKDIYEGY